MSNPLNPDPKPSKATADVSKHAQADAQSREWLTLHGRYFEDYPGDLTWVPGLLLLLSRPLKCRLFRVPCKGLEKVLTSAYSGLFWFLGFVGAVERHVGGYRGPVLGRFRVRVFQN